MLSLYVLGKEKSSAFTFSSGAPTFSSELIKTLAFSGLVL